jgi:putative glutamine amidotransferase
MGAAHRPKIGVSACFFHADPARPIFTGKTLQYVEQSAAHWVMAGGALPVMIPSPAGDTFRGDVTLDDYADWLDGLLLEGGSDLSPTSYGETPLEDRWSGDAIRDRYEMALVAAFVARAKPVFGICRGLQLLNVAFGGTLYQDIATQHPGALTHRDPALYDRCHHRVRFEPHTRLAELLGGAGRARVNSVHHQAVKDLAPGFVVEARCPDDGIIEAIRRDTGPFVAAVQWHPEFHRRDEGMLDDTPLLEDFLDAVRAGTR